MYKRLTNKVACEGVSLIVMNQSVKKIINVMIEKK